jgi:hypothetical protein
VVRRYLGKGGFSVCYVFEDQATGERRAAKVGREHLPHLATLGCVAFLWLRHSPIAHGHARRASYRTRRRSSASVSKP